jgi:undecaprenyl-diphosphatase
LAVGLLAAAVTTSATLVHIDANAGQVLRMSASELAMHASFTVSALGGTDVAYLLTAAATALLLILRHWRGAVTLVLAVLATQPVVDLIKVAVERPRPTLNGAIADASGPSFPSAHSATSMALYATLAFLAARSCRGPARVAIVAAAVSIVGAVGLSRVFLAAHYPTDVLAGWLTGGALVVASWLLVRRLAAPAPSAQAA